MESYNFWQDFFDTYQSLSDWTKALWLIIPPAFVLGMTALVLRYKLKSKQDESDIFQDLPRHLGQLAAYAGAPELSDLLGQAQSELDASIKGWPDRNIVGQHAAAALRLIRRAAKQCPDGAKSEILHRLEAKERQLSKVLALASNISARLRFPRQRRGPETA